MEKEKDILISQKSNLFKLDKHPKRHKISITEKIFNYKFSANQNAPLCWTTTEEQSLTVGVRAWSQPQQMQQVSTCCTVSAET